MRLRAFSLFLSAAALFCAIQAAAAPSSYAYPWCADDRARLDTCYYYSDGLQCRVTMTGLGICVPIPSAPPRHRRVSTERRH